MAISTQGIILVSDATAVDADSPVVAAIKEFPDLIGLPNPIEVTTLSDTQQTYINGIKQTSNLEFTANYTETDYDAVLAKCATDTHFAVIFGTYASNEGIFGFDGEMSVSVIGGGVDSPVEMKISIAPSTAIVKS